MKLRHIFLWGLSCIRILKCCQLKKEDTEKLQVSKNIFYFELHSKPNFGVYGITVSMWEKY